MAVEQSHKAPEFIPGFSHMPGIMIVDDDYVAAHQPKDQNTSVPIPLPAEILCGPVIKKYQYMEHEYTLGISTGNDQDGQPSGFTMELFETTGNEPRRVLRIECTVHDGKISGLGRLTVESPIGPMVYGRYMYEPNSAVFVPAQGQPERTPPGFPCIFPWVDTVKAYLHDNLNPQEIFRNQLIPYTKPPK